MSLPSKIVRLPAAQASVFGKYQLIAKLGQGGMAEVFLAAHRGPIGFEKLVVIKRLKPSVAADPEVIEMFLDEARIAARLNHPNVVQTYEYGSFDVRADDEEDGAGVVDEQHYLAMEYLDGQPLDRVIHRLGDGHLGMYLAIVSDALAGLHHAHELADFDGVPLHVVHRDVSPHNIFVTYAGQAKVVDFGIAKWTIRSAETSTGVVKGKIAYMAPEQSLSAPLDRRADLFSVGVILWEIAAGERFWGSLSEVQILQKMAFGELPRLSDRKPDAPEALRRICDRALSMAPADRYDTAADMREDIEALLASLGRRPTAAEIGTAVAEAFADRREEAKTVIGAQLRQARDAAGDAEAAEGPVSVRSAGALLTGVDDDALPVLDDRAGPPSVRGRSRSQRAHLLGREATPSAAIASPPPAPPAPQAGRRRAIAIAALLASGAAGAGLFAALQSPEAQPPAAMERPRAEVSATPIAAPVATADTLPHPALIELQITATPANARIFLDDVAVPSNPFSARFPRDGTGHRIRVEADGYVPDARMVVFEADTTVEIGLVHSDSAIATPAIAQLPRPGKPAATDSARRPDGEAIPAPSSLPSAPPSGPKVDTTDPWAENRRVRDGASGPSPR